MYINYSALAIGPFFLGLSPRLVADSLDAGVRRSVRTNDAPNAIADANHSPQPSCNVSTRLSSGENSSLIGKTVIPLKTKNIYIHIIGHVKYLI